MAKLLATPLDFNGLEAIRLRVENLATDPTGPDLFEGRIWINTTSDILKYYDGAAVIPLTADTAGVLTLAVDNVTIENTGTATNPNIRVKALGISNAHINGPIDFSKLAAPVADWDINSHKILNLTTPTAGSDAANKSYVDAATQGIDWKASVRVASVINGTLATAFANASVVDGVTLVTGDRILLKAQTAGAENGIYTVSASGAPVRATDADSNAEVSAGMATFVGEGTVNGNTAWMMTTNDPIVLNTTALVFSQFGAGAVYTAGSGIDVTGNVISLVVPVTVLLGGTGATTVAGAKTSLGFMTRFTASIGNGALTSITVTHNLGTLDVVVSIFDNSTGAEVIADIVHATTNTLTIGFAVAPTSNQYRVVVIG